MAQKHNFLLRLGAIMESRGLTQAHIASLADISPQAVSLWFAGEAVPSEKTAVVLAERLNTTVSWLLAGEGAMSGAAPAPIQPGTQGLSFDHRHFGRRMRELMIEHNTTFTAVSEATGVAQSMMSRWIHGRVAPRPESIERIAGHFKIPLSDLLLSQSPNAKPERIPESTLERLIAVQQELIESLKRENEMLRARQFDIR